jgi:hypothetical protein
MSIRSALAPDSAHEWLGGGIRPRRSDRGLDDPDALCAEHGVEKSAELGISITDEELDRVSSLGELHADVSGLLGHPVGDRPGRQACDPDDPRVVVDEEEHVGPAEQHGIHAEKVAGDQAFA